MKYIFHLSILLSFTFCSCVPDPPEIEEHAASDVLKRILGEKNASRFIFKNIDTDTVVFFSILVEDNKIHVSGNSVVALCRGAYEYLRDECGSIVSWSGDRINLPVQLEPFHKTVRSPFKYHYYMNTVTHGYTTPYWGWDRWERELDWMAIHGMDMPLIAGAHEAILFRVFEKLGLEKDEILDYFSGPAHLPWNRMGNIGGWDGPPPITFFQKQIDLTHKMLDRMKELEMIPVVHAFAGFVPSGLKRIYPNEELRELGWGGFNERVKILAPNSELFSKIGTMYILEWEKEFGKGKYYLADSFNEMDVPLSDDPEVALKELAGFGEAVFNPIAKANPDAVWVMQGWTFPYHRKNGELFWTPERLHAMMSKIPDDKLLILDMANEYNAIFWKIDYSWKMYKGFFGKQWIYSFIPNMGGKVPLNGELDFYATAPARALDYERNESLVGFGFAPEGIENNEVIYELLTDWGWREEVIDLDKWLEMYSQARYGGYPEGMKEAWELLRKSALGTFTDHPRFRYQFRPEGNYRNTVHKSEEFKESVMAFLSCDDELKESKLYTYDAIELGTQLLGHRVDELLAEAAGTRKDELKYQTYADAIGLMKEIDKLLASHPNHKLSNWVKLARDFGDTQQEKNYYESNAKRLITTWGGGVNEYAARTWSGLIGDYYAARWQAWIDAQKSRELLDILNWEETWINTPWVESTEPYEDPVSKVKELIKEYE